MEDYMNKLSSLKTAATILCVGLFTVTTYAADIDIKLNARVRGESKSNSDYMKSGETSKIGSRFRINMNVQADDKTSIFIQPQYTETWGTTAASGLADGPASIHQAYLTHAFSESYSLKLGRQEINFGDQLVVGAVGWHPVSRTFNAMMLQSQREKYGFDLFTAKTDENGVAPDDNFYGLYFRTGFGESVKEFDAYHLVKSFGATASTTASTGVRVKSKVGERFDYRAEVTSQTMTGAADTENQIDAEVGYMVMPAKQVRLALEYFAASKAYDQMYPTGHKWLGFADQFSRKNISGLKFTAGGEVMSGIRAYLMFHQFTRTDDAVTAYNFAGAGYGALGTSTDIGSEIDVVVGKQLSDSLKLSVGLSQFTPGQYLKDNGGTESGNFGFVQLMSTY